MTEWARADAETLTVAGDSIQLDDQLSSETGKEGNQVVDNLIPSGNTNIFHRFGTSGTPDSGNNYSSRRSINGGASTDQTNASALLEGVGTATPDQKTDLAYFGKLPTQELLWWSMHIDENGTGAGTAPEKAETAGKWANTSALSDVVEAGNGGAGDFDSGSSQAWFTDID